MKRAQLVYKLNDALVLPSIVESLPFPPDPWFVRGPRGGVYLATGEVERLGPDWQDNDFMYGVQSVGFRSEGSRYLRPGSALYKQATQP